MNDNHNNNKLRIGVIINDRFPEKIRNGDNDNKPGVLTVFAWCFEDMMTVCLSLSLSLSFLYFEERKVFDT